jgi:hypothetical protein
MGKTTFSIFVSAARRLDHAIQANEFMNDKLSHVGSYLLGSLGKKQGLKDSTGNMPAAYETSRHWFKDLALTGAE